MNNIYSIASTTGKQAGKQDAHILIKLQVHMWSNKLYYTLHPQTYSQKRAQRWAVNVSGLKQIQHNANFWIASYKTFPRYTY